MCLLLGISSRSYSFLILVLVFVALNSPDECLAFVTFPQHDVTHCWKKNCKSIIYNYNRQHDLLHHHHHHRHHHNRYPLKNLMLVFSNPEESNNENSSTTEQLSKEEKFKSYQQDIQEKFKEERSYNTFGFLSPIAKTLDEVSGDWALSYADLTPATPRTIEGQAFLATNVGYAAAGLILGVQGDWFFAFLTELAGIVSFWYHYSQLEFGQNREEVRLALLTDYFTAGAALVTGGFYMAEMGISGVPLDALITGGAAVVCLSLCWVWEVS